MSINVTIEKIDSCKLLGIICFCNRNSNYQC